jgi:acetyltransferase-like isoleucine patch superfamily enzyme
MPSQKFTIKDGYTIPYYDFQHRNFRELVIKIKNTVLSILAFQCPLNNLRIQLHRLRGVHIGKNVYIGMRCTFDNLAPNMIYIEDNTNVNSETMILTHFNPSSHFASIISARVEPVVIQKDSIISVRCIILPGVIIGKGAVVAAGSIVDKSVSDYTMVRGNPAKEVLNFKFLVDE